MAAAPKIAGLASRRTPTESALHGAVGAYLGVQTFGDARHSTLASTLAIGLGAAAVVDGVVMVLLTRPHAERALAR